jgi:hypothetical protein
MDRAWSNTSRRRAGDNHAESLRTASRHTPCTTVGAEGPARALEVVTMSIGWARTAFAALFLGLVACASADETPGAPKAEEDESAATTAEGDGADEGSEPSDKSGPPDDDPDRDMSPTALVADDTTTPPATQDELMKRFAPHLHLHPDDPNRPANVDWYLARVSMRFNHNNCPDHELLAKGKVTQQTLIAQTHNENKSLCRHDDGKKVTSTAHEGFFLEVADEATYKGADRKEWKTYVVWRPISGGLVNIEYWIFYPYNDGFSLFNHESDWEHVRVTIDPKAEGGQGAAREVKLSAHKGGTILKADDARLTMEGTHPVAYVAKGTHANYPQPGTFAIEGTAGVAKDNTKAAAPADVWKTEGSLVAIGTRAAPKNGQVFIKYWGRWGELGDLPETNGVTRHFP